MEAHHEDLDNLDRILVDDFLADLSRQNGLDKRSIEPPGVLIVASPGLSLLLLVCSSSRVFRVSLLIYRAPLLSPVLDRAGTEKDRAEGRVEVDLAQVHVAPGSRRVHAPTERRRRPADADDGREVVRFRRARQERRVECGGAEYQAEAYKEHDLTHEGYLVEQYKARQGR